MVSHVELLARYKHLRRAGIELNNRLTKLLDKSALNEGGRKLGILNRNVLEFDTEDEIAVLMDFSLHDVRRNGINAIERYMNDTSRVQSEDDRVLLPAWRDARYALLVVDSVEPGIGVHASDLLRNEPLFVMDVGLGSTAKIGLVLATRVVAPEGITMTGGAALPIGVMTAAEQTRFINRLKAIHPGMDFGNPTPEEATDLTLTIIRSCLHRGAAEKIQYVESGQLPQNLPRAYPSTKALPSTGRIGRNDPCPCGSGQKYKKCCGSRS